MEPRALASLACHGERDPCSARMTGSHGPVLSRLRKPAGAVMLQAYGANGPGLSAIAGLRAGAAGWPRSLWLQIGSGRTGPGGGRRAPTVASRPGRAGNASAGGDWRETGGVVDQAGEGEGRDAQAEGGVARGGGPCGGGETLSSVTDIIRALSLAADAPKKSAPKKLG